MKALVFLGLVAGFIGVVSLPEGGRLAWGSRHAMGRALYLFVAGAVLAVWGDKEISTIDPDPVSLRPAFVLLGALLMLFGLVLGWSLADGLSPNS